MISSSVYRLAFTILALCGTLSETNGDVATCTSPGRCQEVFSEGDVEQLETVEMSDSQVEMLQKKLKQAAELNDHTEAALPSQVPPAAAPAKSSEAVASLVETAASVAGHAEHLKGSSEYDKLATEMNMPAIPLEAINPSLLSWDHNGKACLMCNGPLKGRSNKEYKTRKDCGSSTTSRGPTVGALSKPVSLFSTAGGGSKASSGFCELNFERSCADAIFNEDYLYWAKSLDLSHEALKDNNQWDARYCHLNGFLSEEVVRLQHNFTGLQAKAKDLCETKYSHHPIKELTFRDMMTRSRYDDPMAPSQQEAEVLAAWNCAMGDLGCDMALCAYSFCQKGEGQIGLYGECEGWDPVQGMPFKI